MLKRIISGYGLLLGSLVKVVLVLAVCVAFAFAFVYPLWFFATSRPPVYTVTVFVLFLALGVLFGAVKIRAFLSGPTPEERRKKRAALALFGAKIAVLIAGVCVPVSLVFQGRRLPALIALIAAIGLYGACAFGTKNT
ncbi:MAG: hypothetical protein LBR23_09430 [Spirochaetaceae bacterium]|jgi:hypothetical protein|nr:hypothetical protein [Spirochaetaceae bacterium]